MTIGFYVLNASVISVYVGELFSTRYRFRGAGISQGAGKAVNVVMPFAVTWILANLQPNVIYFGIVAIAPLIVGKALDNYSLAIGGTSVIIVVGVALETVRALEAQMLMRNYKGFLD